MRVSDALECAYQTLDNSLTWRHTEHESLWRGLHEWLCSKCVEVREDSPDLSIGQNSIDFVQQFDRGQYMYLILHYMNSQGWATPEVTQGLSWNSVMSTYHTDVLAAGRPHRRRRRMAGVSEHATVRGL